MRDLLSVRAIPSAILALSLGFAACGGGSEAGAGGSGGTTPPGDGGSGGSGGSPPSVTPSTECVNMCAHVYRELNCGFQDPATGRQFEEEDCQQFCTTDYPDYLVECYTKAPECTNEVFDRCKVPDPTPACDAVCEHVHSEACNLHFEGPSPIGPETLDYESCRVYCPAQAWSKDRTTTDCLTHFDCSEGMTAEQRREALEACIPVP